MPLSDHGHLEESEESEEPVEELEFACCILLFTCIRQVAAA
jgi:hypothetical protein